LGIIAKQTLKGSVWSYLGVAVGFITTTYLYTTFLTPEIVGLFGLIIAISTITSVLASLGFNGVTLRMFPKFRDKTSGHNGYLFATVIPQLTGFLVFLLCFYLLRGKLVESNLEKSKLFADYIDLIIPVTFFFLVYNLFDSYLKVLYDAVTGTFLQEFFQRVMIFLIVLLYALNVLSLNQLIIGFVVAVCLKTVVIIGVVWRKGELNLRPKPGFISKPLGKEMIDVALFYILGGLGSLIVFNIDKIIINQMLDLGNTGVYTIAFYFGTLVSIPSRPLLKISGTLIADAWAKNDVVKIKEIYSKSCINQFVIGGFLFLGIWANIDNILIVLGPEYAGSKWVIFFIGLGYLIDMLTGVNGMVINLSKSYRVSLYFILALVFLVVALLYFLIPLWGIVGAAVAIAVALFLNNLMRYVFLLKKYGMQPFSINILLVAGFYIGLYFLLQLIPQQQLIIDMLIRGALICIASVVFYWFMPVSEDVKAIKEIVRAKMLK
jgi:O-antigen/teichoic acid export membrane protein